MILVGLTGGIGSGKTTVSQLLSALGAVIIDADAITRELQQPGGEVLRQIVEAFGGDVLLEDGNLNRPALAAKAFGDADALAALNKIVHPAVGKEMNARLEKERKSNNVVILDIPLLVENPREGLSGIVVVDIPTEIAAKRLVEFRGMALKDAEARIAKQATREARRVIANKIIDNSGDLASLTEQVTRVWEWMKELSDALPDAGKPSRPNV